MRTIQVNLYQFDELSDEAKERARDWWRFTNWEDEWWDNCYEDAKNIKCNILHFDIGRSWNIGFELSDSLHTVVQLIADNHGRECDTYKLVQEYYRRKNIGTPMAEEEFRQQLGECYLTILQKEREFLDSDEVIDETLRANEYEFTENGKQA